VTGADGITVTGADGITVTGADATGNLPPVLGSGLQSLDPELAVQLNRLTDDSNVNAVVVYHQLPTDEDINALRNLGLLSGTRYRALPMITLTATRSQLVAISHFRNVRSIYGNRTLQWNSDSNMALNNAAPVSRDADLTRKNSGLPLSGKGVTVAVLDTGVDATQGDLAGRVVQNVKLADVQSLGVGFLPPVNLENLPDTDLAYGHGTFVAGIIAGSGLRSGGKYAGVAPGAQLVGLSAGDVNLSFVLAGFDYLLSHPELNTRVVNCSFSANTVFDLNDPVNIATRMLTDNGINVVFSAGNSGSGPHTLNPYAVAPWVISVGATDARGRLAGFSSRGDFGSSLFQPTLVAPGVSLASLRATGVNITGATGLGGDDTRRLSLAELLFYTTGTGTSFSAPQVAGAIALMLEANPSLTPAQVRDILRRSATPMPGYYTSEVGAGMLNIYGAVMEAAFPQDRMGTWRAVLNQGQVSFVNDPVQQFSGSVMPGGVVDSSINVPANAVAAAVQVGWGSLLSATELGLTVYDPAGKAAGQANAPLVPGITGGREGVSVKLPAAGAWKARVTGALGAPQTFKGVVQITRVQYGPLKDLDESTVASRDELLQVIRNFIISPRGSRFRPSFSVSRADFAETAVRAGLAPQYLPPQSHYNDLRDATTRLFVESVQFSPSGPLFDVTAGSAFRPDDQLDRLTAAIALVRAAGLKAEAESKSGITLPYTDTLTVPSAYRGYVITAIAHGLLSTGATLFRPDIAITRGELAHAMVVIGQIKNQ
jgi:serine protease AprX